MSVRVKYHIICHRRMEYPVTVMCRFFDVSRSGYYAFAYRQDRPEKGALLRSLSHGSGNADSVQRVLYLSVIRDLYDNSTVAYKTGTQQTVALVLDTICLAMKQEKKRGAAELQLYSD